MREGQGTDVRTWFPLEESGEQGEVLLEKPLLLDYVDPLQKDDPLGADYIQDRLQIAYALWMLESGRCGHWNQVELVSPQ